MKIGIIKILLIITLQFYFTKLTAYSQSIVRIKDIGRISTSREYQILGYGLVTGLDGTGDKSPMSIEMIKSMLQKMGLDLDKSMIQSRNCAAVVVTATIPPFSKAGDSFDVIVSSIGDCKSLQGGVLLPTLLKGGNGKVYAVAQGNISVGGINQAGGAAAGAANATKNHLTVGRIPNGAILEQEVGDNFLYTNYLHIILQNKDSSLSRRVKESIEKKIGPGWAKVTKPGTIEIKIPESFKDDPVTFASIIEDLTITVEEPNRVVINERTGTIVVGNKVRIGKVVISQGNLRLEINSSNNQNTTNQTRPNLTNREIPKGSLIKLDGETTVDDLVKALNAIGASPKDIIAIFQAIHAAGALHGELKLM